MYLDFSFHSNSKKVLILSLSFIRSSRTTGCQWIKIRLLNKSACSPRRSLNNSSHLDAASAWEFSESYEAENEQELDQFNWGAALSWTQLNQVKSCLGPGGKRFSCEWRHWTCNERCPLTTLKRGRDVGRVNGRWSNKQFALRWGKRKHSTICTI